MLRVVKKSNKRIFFLEMIIKISLLLYLLLWMVSVILFFIKIVLVLYWNKSF